jgi:hypothetical protein
VQGEQLKDTAIGSTLGTVRAHREERRHRVASPTSRVPSSEARARVVTPVEKPATRGEDRPAPKAAPPDVSVAEKLLEAKRQRARARREE